MTDRRQFLALCQQTDDEMCCSKAPVFVCFEDLLCYVVKRCYGYKSLMFCYYTIMYFVAPFLVCDAECFAS